jgi:hypothetical protein
MEGSLCRESSSHRINSWGLNIFFVCSLLKYLPKVKAKSLGCIIVFLETDHLTILQTLFYLKTKPIVGYKIPEEGVQRLQTLLYKAFAWHVPPSWEAQNNYNLFGIKSHMKLNSIQHEIWIQLITYYNSYA